MSEVVLKATKRTVTGRKVNRYRVEGKLPAVMYGSHFGATPIFLERHETVLALRGVSSSTILTVELDGEKHSCLLQDVQKDYVRNEPLHLDLRVLTMGEAITTNVRLSFIGHAPALDKFACTLITSLQEIEVEAKPNDLPAEIEVDLSVIDDMSVTISVSDLKIGEGVTVLTDPDTTVASVTALAAEEAEEESDGSIEPEVIEKGKREDEDFED
jgi:large subunit ribosomal protein L25